MNLQQQAQNVAAQGRFGDSMLMHVNPAEVRGLAQAVPLTINPQTGQPEAFLPFLAPVIGSMIGGSLLGGTALGTLGASALGSGLAQWAATGDFKKGLLAGVTGYGLGSIMQGAGAAAEGAAAADAAKTAAVDAATANVAANPALVDAATGALNAPGQAQLANVLGQQGVEKGASLIGQQAAQNFLATDPGLGTSLQTAFQGGVGQGVQNLATGAMNPLALGATAAGMAPTAVMESQEEFARQMAQREEDEKRSRMENFLMNPEPILYSAQGGTTNFNEGGSTEIDSSERFLRMLSPVYSMYKTGDYMGMADSGMLGLMPQMLGPEGFFRGSKEEEIDKGVEADANLIAQAMASPSGQMMAQGGRVGYRRGGQASEEEDAVNEFSGDFQRFTPARQTYDINPNFMPGFQGETMYFQPNTINQPATATRKGAAPVLTDTYTGSKGGYNVPSMSIAPQTSIDPYQPVTSAPPVGLVQGPIEYYAGDEPVTDYTDSVDTTGGDAGTGYYDPPDYIPPVGIGPGIFGGIDFSGIDFGNLDFSGIDFGSLGIGGISPTTIPDTITSGGLPTGPALTDGQLAMGGMEGIGDIDFNTLQDLNAVPNPIVADTMVPNNTLQEFQDYRGLGGSRPDFMSIENLNQITPEVSMPVMGSAVTAPPTLTTIPGAVDLGPKLNIDTTPTFALGPDPIMSTPSPVMDIAPPMAVTPPSMGITRPTLAPTMPNLGADLGPKMNIDTTPKAPVMNVPAPTLTTIPPILNTMPLAPTPAPVMTAPNLGMGTSIPTMAAPNLTTIPVPTARSLGGFRGRAGGGDTKKELPNKGLEALEKVAPEAVEAMGYQEGGSTDIMQDPITREAIQFIMGESDNQQVINDFIAKYGNDMFLQLRDSVLKSLVPGAQTEGLIEGQGRSGMADDIPGVIGANEKIAVSQDEFIVPADVVSALGDGSSDAGSNELYKMMDRVRQAKTGGTTQPPMIDTRKVMPA